MKEKIKNILRIVISRLISRNALAYLWLIASIIFIMLFIRSNFWESKFIHGLTHSLHEIVSIVTLDEFHGNKNQITGKLCLIQTLHIRESLDSWHAAFDNGTFYKTYRYGDLVYKDLIGNQVLGLQPDMLRLQTRTFERFFDSDDIRDFTVCVNIELNMFGSNHLYPFDKYLLLGVVKVPVFKLHEDNEYLPVHQKMGKDVIFKQNIPNFSLRFATNNDLKQAESRVFEPLDPDIYEFYNAEYLNTDGRFAVVLERHLLFRVLVSIMGIFGIIILIYIGFFQEFSKIFIASIGYLLGIWTIREFLTSSDTVSFPNLIDFYIFIVLTLLLILIVFKLIKHVPDKWNCL